MVSHLIILEMNDNRDTMVKAMEIIREFFSEELTDEERTKLKELGLNDNQIEEMIDMREVECLLIRKKAPRK